LPSYFIPCRENVMHAQHSRRDTRAAHYGRVWCITVEYTTVFLESNWLYFLWNFYPWKTVQRVFRIMISIYTSSWPASNRADLGDRAEISFD